MLLTPGQSAEIAAGEDLLRQRIRATILSQLSPAGTIFNLDRLVDTLATTAIDWSPGLMVAAEDEVDYDAYMAALNQHRRLYRIKERVRAFEPQMAHMLDASRTIVWLPLLIDGGIAESQALAEGPSEQRYPLANRELAMTAIANARRLHGESGTHPRRQDLTMPPPRRDF